MLLLIAALAIAAGDAAAANLKSITLSPTRVGSGGAAKGQVTLDAPAPKAGVVVKLNSRSNAVKLSATSVRVRPGRTIGAFTLRASRVQRTTTVRIDAALGRTVRSARVVVVPPPPPPAPVALRSLSVTKAQLVSGENTKGSVLLDRRAPKGGVRISLRSLSGAVKVNAATVIVREGTNAASFALRTGTVVQPTKARIEARFGASVAVAQVVVLPPPPPVLVKSVILSPPRLRVGDIAKGQVELKSPAPKGGTRIKLTQSNRALQLSRSEVQFREGTSRASFTATAQSVRQATKVQVEAVIGRSRAFTQVVVEPPPPVVIKELKISAARLEPGQSAKGQVELQIPAPKGGIRIKLRQSDRALQLSRSEVQFAEGSRFAPFTVTAAPVTQAVTVTVEAILGSSRGVTRVVVVPPPPVLVKSVILSPTRLRAGDVAKGQVDLQNPAPRGGTRIKLNQSNAALQLSQSVVQFREGTARASFTATAKPVTQATTVRIEAAIGQSKAAAQVTIDPPPAPVIQTLTLSKTRITLGESATATVQLDRAATATVTVRLNAAPTALRLSSTRLAISAGRTSGTFQVVGDSVRQNTAVKLSAQAGGSSKTVGITVVPPLFQPIVKRTPRIQFTGLRFRPVVTTTPRLQFTGLRFRPLVATTPRLQFTGLRFQPIVTTTPRIQFTGLRFRPIVKTTSRIQFTGLRTEGGTQLRPSSSTIRQLRVPRSIQRQLNTPR